MPRLSFVIKITVIYCSSGFFVFMPFSMAQNLTVINAVMSDEEITVDGRLDEAIWQQARPISGFNQLAPSEGEPSSRNTEIRIVFGSNGLLIGALMHDDPESVERALGRRDEYNRADWAGQRPFDLLTLEPAALPAHAGTAAAA